jgi:hypothetical protein
MPDPTPGTLAEALAQLQGRLPRVAKEHTAKVETKTGGNYKYAYADLTDVSEKLLPILSALGLSFTARPTISGDEPRFVLLYTLHHISGDGISGEYPLPDPDRLGPQDLGKAITYARRYALCAVLGLAPAEDDDDANAAAKEARDRQNMRTRQGADESVHSPPHHPRPADRSRGMLPDDEWTTGGTR